MAPTAATKASVGQSDAHSARASSSGSGDSTGIEHAKEVQASLKDVLGSAVQTGKGETAGAPASADAAPALSAAVPTQTVADPQPKQIIPSAQNITASAPS